MKLKRGKKTGLVYFNYSDIKSWNPCYDPNRYLPEDWRGTAVDILKDERIPFQDRLWVVLRTDLVSDRVMRLFAVWCYRQTLVWVKNPDPRSIAAADTAERYANGEATAVELSAAWSAARSAVWSAARSSVWSAAESAVWSAVWSAAESAAESAVWSAVWSAAESAWSAQRDKLIEMVLAEGKEIVKARSTK